MTLRTWLVPAVLMTLVSPPLGAHGPTVEQLQRAALRRAGLEPASQEEMLRRLRLAPLLPQLTVSVWRGVQLGRPDLPVPLADPERLSFALTARWDLSRLVFSRDELAVRAQAQRAAQLRRALRAEIAQLYARHQEALRQQGPEAAQARELGALLEALTAEAEPDLAPQD
ncbi:MAG: hypothetical protein RMK29_13855 [Myxococcales bacterium]|nr:hypothetical protein [Myxococcota bacterium]MDW8282794.1 hypothetical protein [Myxococcales bacterium]